MISATEVNTGKYVIFDESTPFSDLPTLIIASASIPFIFPHRHYKDYILMDGSTIWNTNIISAVDKCAELGYTED